MSPMVMITTCLLYTSPYADKNEGLFEIKEFVNEKTGFASTQTLITPKGRETFRLLYLNTIV